MAENILEKIIKKKIGKIDKLKKSITLNSLKDKIDENKLFFDFKEKIQKNIDNNKISINSPLARALIGKIKKDIVEVISPKGTKTYTVIEVKYK